MPAGTDRLKDSVGPRRVLAARDIERKCRYPRGSNQQRERDVVVLAGVPDPHLEEKIRGFVGSSERRSRKVFSGPPRNPCRERAPGLGGFFGGMEHVGYRSTPLG